MPMKDEIKPPGTLVTGVIIKKQPGDLAGVHLEVRHGKVWISNLTDTAARNPIMPLKVGDMVFEVQGKSVDEYLGGIKEMRQVIANDTKIRILAQRQDLEASSISTDSEYQGEFEMDRRGQGEDDGWGSASFSDLLTPDQPKSTSNTKKKKKKKKKKSPEKAESEEGNEPPKEEAKPTEGEGKDGKPLVDPEDESEENNKKDEESKDALPGGGCCIIS